MTNNILSQPHLYGEVANCIGINREPVMGEIHLCSDCSVSEENDMMMIWLNKRR